MPSRLAIRAKLRCALQLALGVAGAAGHRVDEEVGDVDAPRRGPRRLVGVGHVAAADLAAGALEVRRPRWVAHEAAHARAVERSSDSRDGRR